MYNIIAANSLVDDTSSPDTIHPRHCSSPDCPQGPCILHSLYKINAVDGAGVCQNSIPI